MTFRYFQKISSVIMFYGNIFIKMIAYEVMMIIFICNDFSFEIRLRFKNCTKMRYTYVIVVSHTFTEDLYGACRQFVHYKLKIIVGNIS